MSCQRRFLGINLTFKVDFNLFPVSFTGKVPVLAEETMFGGRDRRHLVLKKGITLRSYSACFWRIFERVFGPKQTRFDAWNGR